MGILKIDGKNKDKKNRIREEEFNISLIVRGGEFGVQVDIEITPLFCTKCNKQLDGLFALDGSRYGYVGVVICDKCGFDIHCSDDDNIVTKLKCGDYIIDYYKLYNLDKNIWDLIKDKTGYDIYKMHKKETITLEEVINEIYHSIDINIDIINDINDDITNINGEITKFPHVVIKWFSLLKYLNLKI